MTMTSTNLISLSDSPMYKINNVICDLIVRLFVYSFIQFSKAKKCTLLNIVNRVRIKCCKWKRRKNSAHFDQFHEFLQFMWSVILIYVDCVRLRQRMLLMLTRSLNKLFKTNFNRSCELSVCAHPLCVCATLTQYIKYICYAVVENWFLLCFSLFTRIFSCLVNIS